MKQAGLILLLALTVTACGGPAAQEAWLHGTWTLTHNPHGDSDDALRFTPDGTVAIHTENDRVIRGKYAVIDDDLALTLVVDSRPIDVHFDISEDRTRLVFASGAYYTRDVR